MDLELTDEQQLLRATVAGFLDDRAPLRPWVRDLLDDPVGVDDAVWRGLADLGVLGLLVPARYGGADSTMVDAGVVLTELGRAVYPGPYVATAVVAPTVLLRAGSAADHERWLPGLADGSVRAAVLVDQPVALDAPPTPGGDVTLLGTASRVDEAFGADLLVVCVDDVVVAVAGDAPGLEVTSSETVDPTRKTAEITLTNTPGRVLGGTDHREAIAAGRDRFLTALVADGLGAAELALDLAVSYAKERVQFDRPIGSFQAVQHLCADMLTAVEMTRVGVTYALWACDAADPTERRRAATMAKAYASDALYRVAADAIQVFGGVGFTWEHDIGLPYKRLLNLQHHLGGSRQQLADLADLAFGATSHAASGGQADASAASRS